MNYAICNETFQGWEWLKTCDYVAGLGYNGIEIAPFTLAPDVRTISSQARSDYARTARDAGLQVVGLHWLLVSPKGLSVTSPDAAIRSETAAYLASLVDFCADLGGKVLVLGSPAQRRLPPVDPAIPGRLPFTWATERMRVCLESALKRAETHDIVLCLEPLPPPEADFILTLREAVTLITQFRHPALRTIFDVKSASSEARPLPDLIREFAPYIAHVHANDSNRRGPGFGETDFHSILATLQEVGYSGYISVEVFDYSPDPQTIARESLAYLQQCERGV